jgi:uncharacterized protein (TIGR00269 family)
MDCNCGKKAVIELKYANAAYCPDCFTNFFEKRVYRTVSAGKLVQRGEKIGLAVSGGKDSLSMAKILKPIADSKGATLEAVLVDEGIAGYRDKTVELAEKFLGELEIPLHVFSIEKEFGRSVDNAHSLVEGSMCSYCGVLRRALLNRAARGLGFDKLAFAHNLDDEIQAIVMNFFRGEHERIARAKQGLVRHELFVQRIKPFRETPEREIVAYAMIQNIPMDWTECPNARLSYRIEIRDMLNALEARHPGTKQAILASGDRLAALLEKTGEGFNPAFCKTCGEIAVSDQCAACKLVQQLEEKASRAA